MPSQVRYDALLVKKKGVICLAICLAIMIAITWISRPPSLAHQLERLEIRLGRPVEINYGTLNPNGNWVYKLDTNTRTRLPGILAELGFCRSGYLINGHPVYVRPRIFFFFRISGSLFGEQRVLILDQPEHRVIFDPNIETLEVK